MNILFCGGGALGSHALYFSRNLDVHLAVVDGDRVEAKNLASQWFVKPMVGKNKAAALKRQIFNFTGNRVKDFGIRLTNLNVREILHGQDLVVDCFDNGASREVIQQHVLETSTPCLHAGLAADGTYGTVRWDEHFVIDHEPKANQPTCEDGVFLTMIVRVGAVLASTIQAYVQDGSRPNWNVWPGGSEAIES